MHLKDKSSVSFMIDDESEEEEGIEETHPNNSYERPPAISLSEPSSPELEPTQIIIHGRPLRRDGLSSSMPRMDYGKLSTMDPSCSNSSNFSKHLKNNDCFPFPDMDERNIQQTNTSTINEDTSKENSNDTSNPDRKEANRLVKNIINKKGIVNKLEAQPKKSILSNLLSVQQHHILKSRQKGHNNKLNEESKEVSNNNKKKISKRKLRGSLDDSKLNLKGFLTPNSSYNSLADFFGIGNSRRSSMSSENHLTSNGVKEATEAIENILKKQNFMIELCKAFILYGSPSHRLESNMLKIAKALGLRASFASLPGLMLISFTDKDLHTSETILLKSSQGYDMYKLEKVTNICRELRKKNMNILDATSELERVIKSPNLYPPWVEILNYGLGSFAIAPMLFDGGWIDAAVAGLLGLLVGVMMLLARKFEGYSNVFELSAAIVSAFIATVLHSYVCFWVVVLSATVNLLPGLTLTIAVIELASKNMVSGAVKMFYSLIVAFILGFGLSLGVRLYTFFDHTGFPDSLKCSSISPWWNFLLFPLTSISSNIFLMAHPRQWGYMSFITLLGYLTYYFTTLYGFSKDLIPAVSAFVVGLASNLLAKFTDVIPTVPLLSAIILLVPGSLGVKGSVAILVDKSAEGASFALEMIIIALSITVGLFFSTFVIYPMGRKRSTLMTF